MQCDGIMSGGYTEVACQQRPGLSEAEARKNGLHMAVNGAAIRSVLHP